MIDAEHEAAGATLFTEQTPAERSDTLIEMWRLTHQVCSAQERARR